MTHRLDSDPHLPDPSGTKTEWERRLLFRLNEVLRRIIRSINDFLNGKLFVMVTVTSNYTVSGEDSVILADSSTPITITIPGADTTSKKMITIKMIGAGAVTVIAESGNIDDATSQIINVKYTSISIVSDGTNYWIV